MKTIRKSSNKKMMKVKVVSVKFAHTEDWSSLSNDSHQRPEGYMSGAWTSLIIAKVELGIVWERRCVHTHWRLEFIQGIDSVFDAP